MKPGIVVNAIFGIATELLYTIAIMLAALATCLIFSAIKP
jgi:hypothetical protein